MLKIKSNPANLLMLFSLLLLSAADKPNLKKVKVGKDITVAIPAQWRPMDGLDFTQRYPSVRAPLAAFTNEDRLVDFSVNISATQWPDANVPMARGFFKASLFNMFDKVDFISEGIREIRGKKFIYFEFESRVSGNREVQGQHEPVLKYTYIQYLVEPHRTLVFSFNCPRRLRNDWQEVAREMMEQVRVK
jgi:hypothetical protein